LELKVAGKVQALAALDPAAQHLGSAVPGTTLRTSVVLYSQVWDRLEVAHVQSTCEGLSWQVQPLSAPPEPYEARAACVLTLEFPAPQRWGRFQQTLRITVQPGEGTAAELPAALRQPQSLYLDLEGTMVRPVSFYGSAVLETGQIDLGDVPQGQERTVRILLKVRDAQRDLPGAQVQIWPEFLQCSFRPAPGGAAGLYELTITLPEGTPACQYRSQPIGQLRIDTGHPRIGVVELPVVFAVVPRRRLSD
jgi:hypothetical protein